MLVSNAAQSLEEFYPSVAIATLMRIIRDPNLHQHHNQVRFTEYLSAPFNWKGSAIHFALHFSINLSVLRIQLQQQKMRGKVHWWISFNTGLDSRTH